MLSMQFQPLLAFCYFLRVFFFSNTKVYFNNTKVYFNNNLCVYYPLGWREKKKKESGTKIKQISCFKKRVATNDVMFQS
jgi:hypothetical protein